MQPEKGPVSGLSLVNPVTIHEYPIYRTLRKRNYYNSRCGYPNCKKRFGAWSAELVKQNKDAHEQKHRDDDIKAEKRKVLEKQIR